MSQVQFVLFQLLAWAVLHFGQYEGTRQLSKQIRNKD